MTSSNVNAIDNNNAERIKFVYAAIADTVSTIRALDTKCQILLGICVIPLLKVDVLLDELKRIFLSYPLKPCVSVEAGILILTILCFFAWIGCLVSLFMGIWGRFDPRKVFKPAQNTQPRPNGSFYCPGTFATSIEEMIKPYPQNEKEIFEALAYEHLKLCSIRSEKEKWHKRSMYCFFALFVLFIVLIFLHLFI